MNDIYQDKPLQARKRGASPAPPTAGCARTDGARAPKRSSAGRGENTRRKARPIIGKHGVWVVGVDGRPLTPTTPSRARRLLRDGQAEKAWSKFGTFGIRMLVAVGSVTPQATLTVDNGTKWEGYTVVVGTENNQAVNLDLPDKKKIVRKLEARRQMRRARRFRNCRRRAARFDNRGRKGFIAPSQMVMVRSRLKIIGELVKCYPVSDVGIEDVRFNHAQHRWGANFSTVEVGKSLIREFFKSRGIRIFEFAGYETKELRSKYGYKKIKDKSADRFEAHCSDALAMACEVGPGERVEPGLLVIVDDTYRPVRRQLHDTQPAKGGVRANYSRGTVFGLRKGLLVGRPDGQTGRLCGEYQGGFRYYDTEGKRQSTKTVSFISDQFVTRRETGAPPAP